MLGELTATDGRAAPSRGPGRLFSSGFDLIAGAMRRSYLAAEPNLTLVAVCGLFGMPFYYFVWTVLYPQPYENLALRLGGGALCALLALRQYWPQPLRPLLPLVWYVTVLFVLPFFFTFMMLMNEASTVWLLSALASLFLLVLLVDWANLVVLFTLGSILAWAVVGWATGNYVPTATYMENLPVLLFSLITGSIFSYRSEQLSQERLRAAAEVGSGIGQELRSPLLGIKTGAVSLQNYLPDLFKGHEMATAAGLAVPRILPQIRGALENALQRVVDETEHANTIIDMLQVNTGELHPESSQFGEWRMSHCIEAALRQYPFRDERGRRSIVWRRDQDFYFVGSDILMIHVLLNLIKNGLHAIARTGKGQISLQVERGSKMNALYFRYTGVGIANGLLGRIFEPSFVSTEAGIDAASGLALCKRVVEAFGGNIRCQSKLGDYTEFVLRFPVATGRTADE